MPARRIYITSFDLERLRDLIDGVRASNRKVRSRPDELEKELNRAKIVEPQDIPADVITMNSRVRLIDDDTGEETTYTLVFPSDAAIEKNRISVLAPLGMALLGYRVGDMIEWKVPSGLKRWKVIEVLFQPEAAGRYDL